MFYDQTSAFARPGVLLELSSVRFGATNPVPDTSNLVGGPVLRAAIPVPCHHEMPESLSQARHMLEFCCRVHAIVV